MIDRSGTWRAYWRYLCIRKLRIIRLAGAFDLDGLEEYFQYTVRILLERAMEEAQGGDTPGSEAVARCSIAYERLDGDPASCFELGSGERGMLGSGTITGTAAAEAVPRLDIEITASLAEWELIAGDAESLSDFEEACAIAVPLSMTHRIRFGARADDWCSQLPGPPGERPGGQKRIVLGRSFGLGCA